MLTDLRRFSKKYRVKRGEEWDDCDEEDRAWLSIIPSKSYPGGHMYTISETRLGYMSPPNKLRNGLKRNLLAIDGVEIAQEGDCEFAVSFPVELLDTVARVVKAIRRKKMNFSDEELRIRAERMRELHALGKL